MLPQIKNISMDYCLWLEDDQFPEQYRIRFEPVQISLCESVSLIYENGYGPECLRIISESPDSILIIDENLTGCQINPHDHPEDITDDLVCSLDISECDAEQIAVCLPSLVSALKSAAHKRRT